MSVFSQLFRHPFVTRFLLVGLRALGAALFFIAAYFMTNYYDIKIVGDFEYTRAFLLTTASVLIFGFDHSILHFTGKLQSIHNEDGYLHLYGKIMKIITSIALLVLAIALFVNTFFNVQLVFVNGQDYTIYTVAAVYFYALNMFNSEAFRMAGKNHLAELYHGVVRYAPFLLVVLLLWEFDQQRIVVPLFLLLFVVLGIISSLHIWYLLRHKNEDTPLTYKELLRSSWPMAMTNFGSFLLLSIDLFFITYFLGKESTAIYAQPIKILAIISLIQNAVKSAASTSISKWFYAKDWGQLKQLIRSANRTIFLLTTPVLIVLVMVPELVLSLFGSSYTQGAVVLQILIIGKIATALAGTTSSYMNMTGKQSRLRYFLLSAVVVNLILNYLLIPRIGITGAAIASCSSIWLWYACSIIYIWKKDRVNILIR